MVPATQGVFEISVQPFPSGGGLTRMASFRSPKVPRRRVLRGIGALLALPRLEVFATGASASRPPVRFVSLFQPNGVYPAAWNPAGDSLALTADGLPEILRPLSRHLKDLVLLRQVDSVGAGHVALTSSFLTGTRIQDRRNSVSLDQWIAGEIGRDTRFPSIQLGTEPPRTGGDGGQPIAYANTVSWNSPTTRLAPEIHPRTVFDRLFRAGTAPEDRRAAQQRLSVVDLVLEDAKSLRREVGVADRARLDEYLHSVRDVERQIDRSLNPPAREWEPSDFSLPERPLPGLPERRSHLRIMMDLLVLALRSDATRVATVMTAHGFSRQMFPFLEGVTSDHHGMSHHREQPKLVAEYTSVCVWFMEQFAHLLDQMRAVDEGEGTLLDHTLLLYGCGMKDGNGHVSKDLPLILAGRGGGALRPDGRIHVAPPGSRLADLHLSIGREFGLEWDDFNGTGARGLDSLFRG